MIDKLCYQSKLRYLNATQKFIYALLTLFICVGSRSCVIAVIVFAINGFLTVYKGGVLFTRYLRYLSVPLAFLVLSTFTIAVNFSSTPLDLFAILVKDFYITCSKQSLLLVVQLIFTAMASVSCLYFLSFSTPMTDILLVLKKFYCPALIIELMLLIYRYIFILMEISTNIYLSQKSRLCDKDYKTSFKSFVSLVSVLFIRAIKKSNYLFDAMDSRCYDGVINVLNENYPAKKKDTVLISIFLLLLIIIWIGW
ncbi:MAG: cobalt ECF transporter T component CbiQ [Clostridia bacterium]